MGTLVRTSHAATKRVCGNQPVGYIQIPVAVKSKNVIPAAPAVLSFLSKNYTGHMLSAVSSKALAVTAYRLIHTDISFPKYSDSERSKVTAAPNKPSKDTEDHRRAVSQGLLFGVSGAVYMYMATKIIQSFVFYKSMPGDQLALANTEINLDEIPEGQCKTYVWRKKPLFVAHRTAEDIEKAKKVKLSELRDPQTDDQRVKKDEWLVTIAVCPHLGCVPLPGKGDFGGYYCPCHGSTFDTSGRIRLGPAPTNLEVPPYHINGNTLIVGE